MLRIGRIELSLAAVFGRFFRSLLLLRPLGILEERLDLALQFDRHRLAVAVHAPPGGDPDPAFRDAILLDVGALFALEADSDPAAKQLAVEEGAARVERESVGGRVGHAFVFHIFSSSRRKPGSRGRPAEITCPEVPACAGMTDCWRGRYRNLLI